MSDSCPVVRIVADNELGYITINASDFDPAVHVRLDGDDTPIPGPFDGWSRAALVQAALVLVTEHVQAASDEDLRHNLEADFMQKRRAKAEADRIAAEQAAEAAANLAAMQPEPAVDGVVSIPDDWSGLHWKQRVALAKALRPEAGDIDADAANAIIAAEQAARGAATALAPAPETVDQAAQPETEA